MSVIGLFLKLFVSSNDFLCEITNQFRAKDVEFKDQSALKDKK